MTTPRKAIPRNVSFSFGQTSSAEITSVAVTTRRRESLISFDTKNEIKASVAGEKARVDGIMNFFLLGAFIVSVFRLGKLRQAILLFLSFSFPVSFFSPCISTRSYYSFKNLKYYTYSFFKLWIPSKHGGGRQLPLILRRHWINIR